MKKQIFHDTAKDLSFKPNWMFNRFLIYGVLLIWAFICLFPIYWTITTTFKAAPDVMKGNIVPWWDFTPKWLGLKSLGLSPNTIFVENTVREEFLKRFCEIPGPRKLTNKISSKSAQNSTKIVEKY